MKNDKISITSLENLARYSEGVIVELPEFAEGQPFVAKLKRPSMLMLAKSGKIPNELLASATNLFNGGKSNEADGNSLKDVYDITMVICEASLIEPTLSDIRNAGLELTDEQIIAIFNYAQQGVKVLKPFRTE